MAGKYTQGMFMSSLRRRMLQEQQSQELQAAKPVITWGGTTFYPDPTSEEDKTKEPSE